MTDLAAKAHFDNYDPSSFGWPHDVPDLVPFEFAGVNFGQCARAAHGVLTAVLTELVPHLKGGLHAGRCWAYSTTDDLPDGSWSFHRYGLAMDVNWDVNPMGTYSVNPDTGERGSIPHDAASAIATKYGCEYGGDWSGGDWHTGFKDYMHFECHLSPADARLVQPDTDLLEEIMSLDRNSDDYKQFLDDVAHAVVTAEITSHDGALHTTIGKAIATGEQHAKDADQQTAPDEPAKHGDHK